MAQSAVPSVSIITPAWNSARFIGQAIGSVVAQTFRDWEMTIVDDCSVDDTCGIVEGFMKTDPRIRLIRLGKRSGPAVARNTAIEAASGRYIAFLDSDDMWLPEKLERQLRFMEERGCIFSYSSYKKMNEGGNITSGPLKFPAETSYELLLRSNCIGCLTAVYDAGKIGKVYMPLIEKRQDYGLWLRILAMGHTARLLDECLAVYRVRPGSISNNKLKAAYYQWMIYRKLEGLSLLKSVRCFLSYAYHGYKKYKT
jgi:teichuronic acid biosynthesis glycosyltransferase TuaG